MINSYFYTFLWSITPFLESRASIPLGYFKFGLSIYEAVLVSIFGGICVTTVVLFLLPIFIEFFEKHIPLFDRIMKKILEKTHKKHSHKMAIWGDIFLVIFISVPLPGSGAFSGALIAYLFNVPYRQALFLISLGLVLSGIIIAILSLSLGWGINGHF